VGSIIFFCLVFIGLAVLVVWGLIETWNDPGMSDEDFERIFKRKRNRD